MVSSFNEDFSVTWTDERDSTRNWVYDAIHYGHVQPPLMQDIQRISSGATKTRVTYVNGYAFLTGFVPPSPTEAMLERGPFAVWRDEYLPLVRAICERMRNGDYESLALPAMFETLERCIQEAGDLFNYTILVLAAQMEPAIKLTMFCEAELGPEGPRLASTLLQGFENVTSAGGEGLEALAGYAREHSQLAEALKAGRFIDLDSVEGGGEFLTRLRAYLEVYGRRAESWSLVHKPTWIEDPTPALHLIAQYVIDPQRSPSTAHQRAMVQRAAAEEEVARRLSAPKLAEFRALFDACSKYVMMSEERAFWQLTSVGSLRLPAGALGRKLVAAGVFAEPDDVYFFSLEELKALTAAPANRQDEADRRKALLKRQELLKPPPYIGGPMPPFEKLPPTLQAFFRHFAGFDHTVSPPGSLIKGVAASKGMVRARARVIADLKDGDRLQPGEVLVCRSTSPPWTTLFAIAGGVVTDSGGLLSHSAICAREYAIPCVVATQVATSRIPDGAMITVDGDKGEVTIEG